MKNFAAESFIRARKMRGPPMNTQQCTYISPSSMTAHKRYLCSFLLHCCLLKSLVCFWHFSSANQILNPLKSLLCPSPVEYTCMFKQKELISLMFRKKRNDEQFLIFLFGCLPDTRLLRIDFTEY